MTEFYHVSRSDLRTTRQFNLKQFDGHIEVPGFYSADEFRDFKQRAFPNGISKHGEIYLHNAYKSVGDNLAFTPNELILETTFELVRQLKFPDRKSRFEITFGCLSLEDARKIQSETFKGNGDIYKVSCENYSLADMNLVRQTGSIIGLQVVAEKYWEGQRSPNPFLEVLMENPVNILDKIL